ncbi:desmoglein-2-like [Solea senegalensis]|uniref:Desmoglein-2-like n=1 Tax=Solea senegalensis TaxID=28829 RepID=A0AAV6T8V0_SOLSE|nr:desmoglein-2-like [Solea senegalensis]KAG7525885.1 desmoglein-2-like [Solea senegalensis]
MAPLLRCSVFTLLALFFLPSPVPVGAEGNWPWLQRHKRDWIVAPRKLQERHDYRGLESIARIRSDKEYDRAIFYYISGPGVDQPPIGVFSINQNSGYVKIHSILDREERSFYVLKGSAKFSDGTFAEKDIDLKIEVLDVNDNAPVIQTQQIGYVNESSVAGTLVMKVIATDADQANTPHTKIFYRLDEECVKEGMFFINSDTGEIRVKKNTLDRETKDSYKLTVIASDMNGQSGGNSGTGEVEIKLLDINDNIAVLEKETYEGSVEENTVNVEVMRVKATDMDLIHTENWEAVYQIVTGNEAGYFTITTDRKTNEGIIMIKKALDYEEIKVLNLGVIVTNKAKYNFGSMHTESSSIVPRPYPVTINVVNQKEGPRFQPSVKVVTISEDMTVTSINKVITTYAAIDSDTMKTATNVRYVKLIDEDNWLIIDQKTADIKLNKLPDRESKFLINGTYYAKIICITNDTPAKTATGTVAIQVEDFNDHCPKLTATTQTMCLHDKVIYVTAVDEDEFPNSAPFEFSVIDGSDKGKWTVEHHNETSAILRDQVNLWPGIYQVRLEVKDQQGISCGDAQVVDVTVCNCLKDTKACVARSTSTTGLGVGGVLLLLLGLLLLLLVPLLLLFCLCGGAAAGDFKPIPFDTKQQLISYHTEGQGEDKEVPLLQIPVEVDGGINTQDINKFTGKGRFDGMTEVGGGGFGNVINISTLTEEELHRYNLYKMLLAEQEGMKGGQEYHFSQYSGGLFDGMALSEQFLGEYYSRKSNHAAEQSEQKDALLVYDYEGQESLAGSVGCCSLLENENDLAFLNDLGPKFKTLAEICHGSSIAAEVDFPTNKPLSPVRPSTHTHVHTHSERIRDRDSVNVNTFDTSNVASGSSTIVKEERITERSHGSATLPKVHVQDKILIPNQTMLVQQPTMYYAATPMYVVEPQSNILLMGGTQQQAVGQIGHVGLGQGLVQVSGVQGSQGMVLVDRHVGMDGVTGKVAQGLSQGSVSRSRKVVVVENGSSGVEQGGHLAQGFVTTAQGSAGQVFEVRGPSFSVSSSGPTESTEDFSVTTTPRLQGSQKLVVQRKKVSVTERTVDSNTRA